MTSRNILLPLLSGAVGAGLVLWTSHALSPTSGPSDQPSAGPIPAAYTAPPPVAQPRTGAPANGMNAATSAASTPTAPAAFATAADAALDAVVHIRTTKQVSTSQPWYGFFQNSDPSNFRRGSGSGVILSEDGYIVTNHHVVEGADAIEVRLNDNRSFPAQWIGSDPATDIAVLRIDANGLSALDWGDSEAVRVGDWVLAVGNPFDLTSTVTAGIVSAKARNIQLLRPDLERDVFPVESFIQTDAAVNPGNSGGALVDIQGRLIGINTAIASRTGSYAGYAFAVPSNLAAKVAKDLMEFGQVQRAYLGVTIRPIDEALAAELDLPEVTGILVSGTTDNGGAQEAGIEPGDVILQVQGTPTSSLPELLERVNQFRPGESATVDVWRNGERLQFDVELRDRDGLTVMTSAPVKPQRFDILGARVSEAPNGGVRMEDIGSGPFARAAIPNGAIIREANGQEVNGPDDLIDAIESAKANGDKGVLLECRLKDGSLAWFGLGLR